MDKAEGRCKAYFERFYHDKATKECKPFVYGGCGGNKNNFKTLEECQKNCKPVTKGGKGSQDYQLTEADKKGIYLFICFYFCFLFFKYASRYYHIHWFSLSMFYN